MIPSLKGLFNILALLVVTNATAGENGSLSFRRKSNDRLDWHKNRANLSLTLALSLSLPLSLSLSLSLFPLLGNLLSTKMTQNQKIQETKKDHKTAIEINQRTFQGWLSFPFLNLPGVRRLQIRSERLVRVLPPQLRRGLRQDQAFRHPTGKRVRWSSFPPIYFHCS